MSVEPISSSDHDLLVIIHTKLERALSDMSTFTPNISNLQDNKLDKTEAYKLLTDALNGSKLIHDDHESRIRKLEVGYADLLKAIATLSTRIATWGSIAGVLLLIAEILATVYFK